jgi:hypothetical protein
VRSDRLLVGVDLPEQRGLDEAPRGDQRVTVVERGPQRKRLQHVAFDVDVALQIGFCDIALVQGPQGFDRPLVVEIDVKLGLARAHGALGAIGEFDGERSRNPADTVDEGVEPASG